MTGATSPTGSTGAAGGLAGGAGGATGGLGGVRWGVVALAFLAVLLDGFDTATLAFLVPTMAQQWGIDPAAFTPPLVLTNAGVVLGYLSCGTLGARLGRRTVLISGIVVFGVGTLLTALVLPSQSIVALSVLRLVTGVGLGVVLPAAVSLSVDHSGPRRRELVSVLVTLGLASGLTVGGLTGAALIERVGPAGVFVLAGVLPLLVAAVMLRAFPPDPAPAEAAGAVRTEAKVGRLFDRGFRINTGLVWAFSFLVFIAAYTLTSWVPTLLLGYGFAPAQAPLGLAAVSLGGVTGGLVLLALAARVGIARALIVMSALGIACLVVAAQVTLADAALLLVLGGAGAGLTGCQIGQLTLAVALYPAGTRTTGVGWAAALGRAGSIVGPGIAGILIGLALSGSDILLFTTVPVAVALACAAVLALRQRRSARATPDGSPRPAESLGAAE